MSQCPDPARSLTVSPPLAPTESEVLAGLAGQGSVRRMWPGQPGPRSPWAPCTSGCCLAVEGSVRRGEDPAVWLRFLVREVLAPRKASSVARARGFGLSVRHRVDGRVTVAQSGGDTRLVMAANRLRVSRSDGGGGAAGDW